MRRTGSWPYVIATILAVAAATLTGSAALAAGPGFTLDFPAGQACSFALQISGTGGNNTAHHEANGLIVTGGTGSALTFSGNGNTVSLPSNGAASVTHTNQDGSFTEQLTGHNILILFPTDVPAGPSTTLIVGRVVFSVDTSGVFTVLSTSGKQTDICALLS